MTKPNLCAHCQYFRTSRDVVSINQPGGYWCSNSKGMYHLNIVYRNATCDQFTENGKKAPLWMRILNKVMR